MSMPSRKQTDRDGLSLSRHAAADGGADSLAGDATPARVDGYGRSPLFRSRHPRRRLRLPTVLASLLIGAGVLLLADAGVTLVWQEPITALYAYFKQESLRGDLHALEHAAPTTAARQALDRLHEQRLRIEYLAASLQHRAKNGSAVGFIHIPTIGADYVVVKGTGTSELESGPGIYPETNFPGIPGTTAIAGHRTTWLAPFRSLDALRKGAPVVLDMPYARFTYRVIGSRVVLPTDVSVIDPVGYSRLVLSACTPPFSASHRLIVFARLISTAPLGAARVRHTSVSAGEAFSEERALERSGLPPVLKSHQRLLAPLVS
jgi:sortase A